MKIVEHRFKEGSYNLNNLEIKQRIDSNNKLIEDLFTPNFFTLNNTVAKLLKENEMLQAQCQHSFSNGYCDYCYKQEEK